MVSWSGSQGSRGSKAGAQAGYLVTAPKGFTMVYYITLYSTPLSWMFYFGVTAAGAGPSGRSGGAPSATPSAPARSTSRGGFWTLIQGEPLV